MSNIKPGELRWYRWGDEPAGKVCVWTVKEDRSVKHCGRIDLQTALKEKLIFECPYP